MMLSKNQTLITGVYRTGSEYITHLINCHPEISATMYRVNLMRFVFGRFDPISEKANYDATVRSIGKRISLRYPIDFDEKCIIDKLDGLDKVGYGDVYDTIMTTLYLNDGVSHWAEKCQLVWRAIPSFLDIMRNGKALIVLRDPRAVLASFKYFTNASAPRHLGAVFNCLDVMRHAMSYADDDRVGIVKYEDVVVSPNDRIAGVWETIGLSSDFDLSLYNSNQWQDTYGNQWRSNSSFQSISGQSDFDVNKAINGWKDTLSADEIAFTEMVCGKLMANYGYTKSGCIGNPEKIINELFNDEKMKEIYNNYQNTGDGIEAFPSDPFDPSTWGDGNRGDDLMQNKGALEK